MAKQQCKKCNICFRFAKVEKWFFRDENNVTIGRIKLICRECGTKHIAVLGKHVFQNDNIQPNDINWSTLKIVKEK